MIEHMLTYWYIYIYPLASFVMCLAIIIYERIDNYRGKDVPYKIKTLFRKCKTCNGLGEIPNDHGLDGYTHFDYIQCPDCNYGYHSEPVDVGRKWIIPCSSCYGTGEIHDGLEAWQRGEAQLRWLPCPDCEYGRGIASAKPWRDS